VTCGRMVAGEEKAGGVAWVAYDLELALCVAWVACGTLCCSRSCILCGSSACWRRRGSVAVTDGIMVISEERSVWVCEKAKTSVGGGVVKQRWRSVSSRSSAASATRGALCGWYRLHVPPLSDLIPWRAVTAKNTKKILRARAKTGRQKDGHGGRESADGGTRWRYG